MTLKYYHAEPLANSLKSMLPLKEKGLAFESHLRRPAQVRAAFGLVRGDQSRRPGAGARPRRHDHHPHHGDQRISRGRLPRSPPLRPRDPVGAARMRYWNKFVDEHVMNYVSMHGWHRMVGVIARNIEGGTFEKLLSQHPAARPAQEVGDRALGLLRGRPAERQRQDRVRARQGRDAARRDRVAGGRRLHPRRHQLLFALRDDGRADVPREGRRRELPAPRRMARADDRPPRRRRSAQGRGPHPAGPAHLERRPAKQRSMGSLDQCAHGCCRQDRTGSTSSTSRSCPTPSPARAKC